MAHLTQAGVVSRLPILSVLSRGLVLLLVLSTQLVGAASEKLVSRLWPQEQLISTRPMIFSVPNFATPEECARMLALIDKCHGGTWSDSCEQVRSRLHIKKTNRTDGESVRPLRNSTSFQLNLRGEMEPTVDDLVRRFHLFARHPITHGEGVQVADYHDGEYYGFHHDSLTRRATFLLYLTDVPEGAGGETIFPLVRAPGIPDDAEPPLPPAVIGREREHLDYKVEKMEDMLPYCASDFYLKFRPVAGTAILFYNYAADYSLDQYAIHAGCPVRGNYRKSIMQRWMRFEKNTLFGKAEDDIQQARTYWGHGRNIPPGVPYNSTGANFGGAMGSGVRPVEL